MAKKIYKSYLTYIQDNKVPESYYALLKEKNIIGYESEDNTLLIKKNDVSYVNMRFLKQIYLELHYFVEKDTQKLETFFPLEEHFFQMWVYCFIYLTSKI